MSYALRTIGYFLTWGTFYGVILGAWSGTAIFPVMGTLFAAGWGGGIGMACGLLCGLLVGIIQAFTFHPDIDLDRYRRRLTLGVGVFVPVVAMIMMVATTEGLLWGSGNTLSHFEKTTANIPFRLLSVTALALWSSLSAAYVASSYPAWLVSLKTGDKSGVDDRPLLSQPIPSATGMLARPWINWGTVILSAMAGIAYQMTTVSSYARTNPAGEVLVGGVGGIVIAAGVILLLCFGNAALLTFLRKTVFADDVISISPHKQRMVLTAIALIFTGLTSAWTLIFAPLLALLMAQHVYDVFPLSDEMPDKAKRKEKNALALEERIEEGEPEVRLSLAEHQAPLMQEA